MANIIYILLSIAVYIMGLRIASEVEFLDRYSSACQNPKPELSIECDEWYLSYLPRFHDYVYPTPM